MVVKKGEKVKVFPEDSSNFGPWEKKIKKI